MNNSEQYPEVWDVFIRDARNIEQTEEGKIHGKYVIHHPSKHEWIYANDPGVLFEKFKDAWYEPNLDSPSVYGKIQYIVTHF